MRKMLANLLVRLARRIYPQKDFQLVEGFEPKKLGIGYHITKNDVRKYRKDHPEYNSHRKALDALIEDTKKEIGTNIFAGIYKHNLIDYKINKTLYVADVRGTLNVYASKEK